MKKQVTDKNAVKCNENHGSHKLSHCIYYYKITKICVVVDRINQYWKHVDYCGFEYKEQIKDSAHKT